MFDTACNMLDSVYEEQYNTVTRFITDRIKEKAHQNINRCSIPIDSWSYECSMIDAEDIIEDLNLVGYEAEINGDNIEISWENAVKKCLSYPNKTYNQIKPQTTVGI